MWVLLQAAERSDDIVLRLSSSRKPRIMGSFRLEKTCETIETNPILHNCRNFLVFTVWDIHFSRRHLQRIYINNWNLKIKELLLSNRCNEENKSFRLPSSKMVKYVYLKSGLHLLFQFERSMKHIQSLFTWSAEKNDFCKFLFKHSQQSSLLLYKPFQMVWGNLPFLWLCVNLQ